MRAEKKLKKKRMLGLIFAKLGRKPSFIAYYMSDASASLAGEFTAFTEKTTFPEIFNDSLNFSTNNEETMADAYVRTPGSVNESTFTIRSTEDNSDNATSFPDVEEGDTVG